MPPSLRLFDPAPDSRPAVFRHAPPRALPGSPATSSAPEERKCQCAPGCCGPGVLDHDLTVSRRLAAVLAFLLGVLAGVWLTRVMEF